MIILEKYNIFIQDLNELFKSSNYKFYQYITSIGMELDLTKKDQQKIYFHHLLTTLCDFLKLHNTKNIIYYINNFDICDFHTKMIKKIQKIFGIKIWDDFYELTEFLSKLEINHSELVDKFELFINKNTKPKTFKHIKKYLEKEGFTNLADTYFQDIVNKMVICS